MKQLILIIYGFLLCAITSAYLESDAIVVFNGESIKYQTKLLLSNNTLHIPVMITSKALQKAYSLKDDTLTLSDAYKKIIFKKDSDSIIVNDSKYFMPVKSFVYNNDWYVPLKFYAWYLGYSSHRKDRIYYVSKLLNAVKVDAKSIQLIFPCDIRAEKFILKKEKGNKYSLELANTVQNFPRYTYANKTFTKIALGQITLMPDLVKLYIESKEELELTIDVQTVIIKPKGIATVVEKKQVVIPPVEEEKPQTMQKPLYRSTEKAVKIPSFKNSHDIILNVKGVKKQIKGKAKYVNDEYVLPIEELLLPFGYDYYIGEKNQLYIKYGDKEELDSGINVLKEGEIIYAPVQKLATVLGLGLRWDYRINTLVVNPIINNIEYLKEKDSIMIESYSEISPQDIFHLASPSRLVLNIPNAVLDATENIVLSNSSNFISVRAGQFDEETVRVVVDIKKEKHYALSLSDNGKSVYIKGSGRIQKLNFTESENEAEVTFIGSNMPSYNWSIANKQLIINFKDISYEAKRSYLFGGNYIDKIVGMQYSWDPLQSRVIISLKKDFDISFSRDKSTDLKLRIFSKHKGKKVAEKKVKAVKKTLYGKTIVVESGHGGLDVGAIGIGSVYEKWFNLDISKKVQNILSEEGASVLMALQADQYMSLSARTLFANRNMADLYVSIHLNSFDNNVRHGTETYYYKESDYKLAQSMHKSMITKLKRKDEGIRKARFFVLFHTVMPAVLVEPCYVSNQEEYNLLMNDGFRAKIAEAIVEGIKGYYGSLSANSEK